MKLEFGQTNVHSIEDAKKRGINSSKWNMDRRYQLINGSWINYFHVPIYQHRSPTGEISLVTRKESSSDQMLKVSDSLALSLVQIQ